LQQATLLDTNKHRIRVIWVERNVLGMGDVWRRRESPPRHIHRSQGWEFGPAASEIIAGEQVRRLRAGKNAHAAGQPGARQAIDIVLSESVVALLPGMAAIAAGEDRAVLRSREDRTAFWPDKEGVDVLIGQRPVRDVPP